MTGTDERTGEMDSKPAYRQVIEAECSGTECQHTMSQLMTREMNMVGGRPSDCARSAARDHRNSDSCSDFVTTEAERTRKLYAEWHR